MVMWSSTTICNYYTVVINSPTCEQEEQNQGNLVSPYPDNNHFSDKAAGVVSGKEAAVSSLICPAAVWWHVYTPLSLSLSDIFVAQRFEDDDG